jgi:DNA-binding transcriptional LysR family regulator
LPELDDIRAFTEVVDSGSLTRAGERLGMSKSMVSRRLARLEADLGMPLLARTTRGLSLTEAGGDFRPYAERMVAELQSARDALSRQGEASGRLRLSAPLSFGTTHLAAVLAELAVRHPALEISTSYSDRVVDIVGDGLDAAVRLGNLADSSLIARRIAPVHAVMVASPAYLARAGTPRTPEDLAGHDVVPHGDQVWEFRKNGRRSSFRPRGRFTADSGPAELAGVAAGLGIAMMPAFLAGPAVKRGEIVTLLDDYEIPAAGMYIVRPPPAEPVPNKIKALTDIMVERFVDPGWDSCRQNA